MYSSWQKALVSLVMGKTRRSHLACAIDDLACIVNAVEGDVFVGGRLDGREIGFGVSRWSDILLG